MIIRMILVPIVMSILPIEDTGVKMQIGIVLTELLSQINLGQQFSKIFNVCRKKHITIPNRTRDRAHNPLFDKMQEYLSSKFVEELESCELVPKNGDIEFNITELSGKKFNDTFEELNGSTHKLEIYVEQTKADPYSNQSAVCHQIVIKSKTANSNVIRAFVRKIAQSQAKIVNVIKIYRPMVRGKKKEEKTLEWERMVVKSNKTITNTVYSEEIEKEFFNDVERFMNREEWYARLGIPYKRGYFLYSTPGQGKTSIAKILANQYDIPVFCLDLTIVSDNDSLNNIMNDINFYVNNQKYILLIEDAERNQFMNPRYHEPKLSMDCFLNAIDGVSEPHGRILIMTANDPECILSNKALVRPGRIDKILQLKSCDKYQIKKMYELFYGVSTTIDWDSWTFNEDLSAAYIVKLLQENLEQPDIFMRLIGTAKTGDDAKLIDEHVKKAIENAKAEQAAVNKFDDSGNRHRVRRSRRVAKTPAEKLRHAKSRVSRLKRYAEAIPKIEANIERIKQAIKQKKEREAIAKLKEKAKAKAAKIKAAKAKIVNASADNQANASADNQANGAIPEESEEEYETPAFLANSIPVDGLPADLTYTYEISEDAVDKLDPDDIIKLDSGLALADVFANLEAGESENKAGEPLPESDHPAVKAIDEPLAESAHPNTPTTSSTPADAVSINSGDSISRGDNIDPEHPVLRRRLVQ